jgi:SAM-dependent methyltransferase
LTRSLDLGCGRNLRNPYQATEAFGIDIVSQENLRVSVADLVIEPIPHPDNFFDYITAYDFIEHIPRVLYINGIRRQPFIELMNEIWRVLTPGGTLRAHTPAFPKAMAFTDPTHVNIITEDTYRYFCGEDHDQLARSYGFTGMFNLKTQHWDREWDYHLIWELEAVK